MFLRDTLPVLPMALVPPSVLYGDPGGDIFSGVGGRSDLPLLASHTLELQGSSMRNLSC